MKKEYVSPDLEVVKLTFFESQLVSTLENYSSYIDDGDDDWGDDYG